MMDLVSAAIQFPTIVFSVLLGLSLLYWLVVILGIVDLDLFDSVLGLETVEAASDAAESGAESISEAGQGWLDSLGFGGVPIMISLSFFSLFGWFFSYWGTRFLGGSGLGVLGSSAAAGIVGMLAAMASLVIAGLAMRPLRTLFARSKAPERSQFVGSICRLTTSRVDDGFGQAIIEDGGTGLLVQVRCARQNRLKRGEMALVFDYDARREVYLVEPLQDEDLLQELTAGKT